MAATRCGSTLEERVWGWNTEEGHSPLYIVVVLVGGGGGVVVA